MGRRRGQDEHLGHACHEQGADILTIIGTVICHLQGVYDMPSTALGTFHDHYV